MTTQYTNGGAALPYPEGVDKVAVAKDLQALAESTDRALTMSESSAGDYTDEVAVTLRTEIAGASPLRGRMPEGTDVDELLTPGTYLISSQDRADTMIGLPEKYPSIFIVDGDPTISTIVISQTQKVYGANPRTYERIKKSSAAWNEWKEVGAGTGGGSTPLYGTGTANQMRLTAFHDAYPLVSTGNKGAVVFRYDHGLTNLKANILAQHQSRGIPFHVAMNSRNWDRAESSGASVADAKAWIASGIAEFSNHTATHSDSTTPEDLFDNIVDGRRELESQLGIPIHGFIVPGVGGTGLDGFGSGTLESFSGSLAGSLILASHAVSSGAVGEVQRPLDGVTRQGGRHYTWESQSFASIKAVIDQAISSKTAVTLMAHPSLMGGEGYFGTALLGQVLDYVKSKIDAGQLANISYYQSHHAALSLTAAPDDALTLTPDPADPGFFLIGA